MLSTRLFPGALSLLRPVVLAYVLLNLLVRLGLFAFNGDLSFWWPWRVLPAVCLGLLFDLAALSFALPVLAWPLALWPPQRRGARVMLAVLLLPLAALAAFTAVAEFTFWNEFGSRFNFIAVDYLVYTSEVIGNIRQSYNMSVLLGVVGLIASLLWAGVCALLARAKVAPAGWRPRLAAALGWTLLPVFSFALADMRYTEFSSDARLNELAGNGYYAFWHAFRANEIDYERFYRTLPEARSAAALNAALSGQPAGPLPFERHISNPGPEKKLNVVLVSVESLSAEFLGAFGNTQGLTPALDALCRDGLLFTQLYATGTRTVRGLEALSLSIPPTPGHSIVKRPGNEGLFTLGEVFRRKGYEPLFLYGGYGYFDNMNAFFGGNGYTVVDRTALAAPDIHFENIWGVADEDLFSLTLRQLDTRFAQGKPFFAHVMTTSNHRPYTYPPSRIDIAPGSGREGGVKYTDWAIGRFIEQARARPWFASTVFVIVADHTHKGRGKLELPVENYHIPMLIYGPGLVAPGRVDTLASQIDVGPTLLGLLNFSYDSKFFGHDILREGAQHPRALMANYQTVGWYEQGRVVELRPNGQVRLVDAESGKLLAVDAPGQRLIDTAISHYQTAAQAFRLGQLKR